MGQISCISSSHRQVLVLDCFQVFLQTTEVELRRVVLMFCKQAEPNGFEAEFSALKLHASLLIAIY
jgi:hypothetical protein